MGIIKKQVQRRTRNYKDFFEFRFFFEELLKIEVLCEHEIFRSLLVYSFSSNYVLFYEKFQFKITFQPQTESILSS